MDALQKDEFVSHEQKNLAEWEFDVHVYSRANHSACCNERVTRIIIISNSPHEDYGMIDHCLHPYCKMRRLDLCIHNFITIQTIHNG